MIFYNSIASEVFVLKPKQTCVEGAITYLHEF